MNSTTIKGICVAPLFYKLSIYFVGPILRV